MSDVAQAFLESSRSLLRTDFAPKIERCLEQLSDEDLWWRPNEASNSIGNLLLHLCGNVTEWIVGGVGGRQYQRHRQEEFDHRTPIPRKELLDRLHAVLDAAEDVLSNVNADALLEKRQIQGYDVTVLEAVYHVVEHFSMHTGQIILLSKARVGADLALWEPPATTTSAASGRRPRPAGSP
jgi:uncharacterized damage-inducible protein DinB